MNYYPSVVRMKFFLPGMALLMGIPLIAQDTTKPVLNFSAFAEVYYAYDCNRPADQNRPGFIYSHNRHNEFSVNLAFIKAAYNAERVRANLAFAAGTYINANYAAEPGVLKNLYEANAGIKLSMDHNLWFDMGIFTSHIGFESAESKDCWNLTRSMLAENSPYYEAGAKISFITGNGKWLFSGLALNGWQRISRLPGSSLMNWGSQVMFKPSGKLMLNYSSFIGTDKPDSNRLWRYFHNLYGVLVLNDKFGLTLGFDFGQEQLNRGSRKL
ncbi:MAG TPA: outer membrane beta-barrel protein, partial [Chitinophagaceae bacterium]|nr:outer membrane beta-barrel protein [Chitinophagaceae bacterium]